MPSMSADTINIFPEITRLLRCRKTRRYFTGQGWSQEPSDAAQFSHSIQAARACVNHDLHDIELVLRSQVTGVELFCTFVR